MNFSLSPFTQLTKTVYIATAEPDAVNIGLVVGTDSALVIDTGSSPTQGQQIRTQAEAIAGMPVEHVLVTHWHWDHSFGLAGFAGSKPARTYGHVDLASWLTHPEAERQAALLGVALTDLIPPQVGVDDYVGLNLGDMLVEISFYGRGHTATDLVAYIPSADVLFVGDLVEESGPPVVDFDSYVTEWPRTVEGILEGVTEQTIIVPGHGHPVDADFVRKQMVGLSS